MRSAPLVTVLAAVLAGCTPTFDWREVRPDGALTLLFPCKPDRHQRRVPVDGRPADMVLLSCRSGEMVFGLSYVDTEAARTGAVLQALQDALAANVGAGAPGAVRPLPIAPVKGATPDPAARSIAVSGRSSDGAAVQAQGRFFRQGLRVYQATVVGRQVDESAVESFFGSPAFAR